jgi:recombination protein RecT
MDDASNVDKVAPWDRVIAKAEEKFNEIATADGNLVTFRREAMFAHQAFEKPGSDYLRSCDASSLFNALINVASVGLTLSPAEKLAYLVPRAEGKGKERKVLCCLDISYRGLKKIAEDSGSVLTAVAEVVREGDEFEWIDKLTRPKHRFDPFANARDRGDIRGVYCMAVLANGITQVEALSMEEIKKIRDCSKSSDGPWADWFEEMAKKSAVRRASKMWPHSARMQTANHIIDQHQGLIDLVEAPTTTTIEGPSSISGEAEQKPTTGSPGEPPAEKNEPEKKGPADDKPMQPGQLRILRAKAKGLGISETALAEKFGPEEQWKFGDFATIQTWITNGGTAA